MAVYYFLKTRLERRQIEWSVKPQAHMQVIGGGRALELIEEPQSLLGQGSRIDNRPAGL